MPGYLDTRQMIIDTLMGRPEGTQIQPEDHQAYALNMLNYIRSIELSSGSTLTGIAETDTIPIEPLDSRVAYISSISQNSVETFTYFKNENNQPITITTTNTSAFVIFMWNTQYWEYQILPISVLQNNSFVGYFICSSNADSDKQITCNINEITINMRILVLMENVNTKNNVTLQINSTTAKPLYYNGQQVSSTNTWDAGEILDIYFDGTNYQSISIKDKALYNLIESVNVGSQISATNAFNFVPSNLRKLGLKVTWYDTVNTKWVTNQYIGSDLSGWNTESNWNSVNKFSSGQVLNETSIKDLDGNDDLNVSGILSFEAGKRLNENLYGEVDDNSVLTLAFESTRYGGFQNVSSENENAWLYSTSGTYQPNCGLCIFEAAKLSGYKKIRVTMPLFVNGENGEGRLTFIKRADLPTASKTYEELVAGGYISEVHTAYNNMYITCGINSGYMQVTELDIPDDAIGACFTYRIVGSDPKTRRKPNNVGVFSVMIGGDIPMLKKEVSEQSVVAGSLMTLTAAYDGYIRIPGGLWVANSNVKHAYVDVSELRGKSIVVENNENVATNVAFMTAIDTVENYGEPSYADGFGVKKVADGVLGASSVFKVPDNANYLYVYIGTTVNNATPKVYVGKSIKEIVTEGDSEDEVVSFVSLWPLINLNHIGDSSGTVISDANSTKRYMMGIQPVKKGERLKLTAKCTDTESIVVPLCYGFHQTYPYVGQVISEFNKIQGVNGVTEVRDVTAENDGFFVFSYKRNNETPTYIVTLEKVVESADRERIVAVGERKLHFLPAETSGAISETVADINGLYDALVTAHPECFEKLTDILADNGEGEEVRLYRLGYKDFGGLYTGYLFEDPTENGYYADPNEGGKSHDRLHMLFDAGVHGDEKSAVWGLYLFCKAVCEGTDAWAEYVRSNFIIDIIPIVCTKSYDNYEDGKNGSRLYPGATGSSEAFTNPNRNFAERTILPIDAVAGYIDAHHDEYVLHVDCHNQSNNNAGGKCFVSALRNGLWFNEILQFSRKYAGICKQDWDELAWTKPVNGSPSVSDPKIVMQTNVETALGLNNSSNIIVPKYTQAFPCYTRSYGIVSLTMEAPRRLDNTSTNRRVCNKNAGKLTADLLCELLYIV